MLKMATPEMASKCVSSFTIVGHLLHINLKESLLEFKNQIGHALLDKCPKALAVVNKVNTIENTFRNFQVEIIAKRDGCTLSDEELMIAEVNENKCRFQLDFSKVYWNSRLSTEHERIIGKLNIDKDIVFDLFAGVGPFSVPAAKRRCRTYANDLNPESVKWLATNMKRNKVQEHMYEIHNMDAKQFTQDIIKNKLVDEYKRILEEDSHTKPKIHFIMNLPGLAPTFLPLFAGLMRSEQMTRLADNLNLIDWFREQSIEHIVYCYCFLKGFYEDPKKEVRAIIEQNFGRKLTPEQFGGVFRVRNVAPYKEMYRIEIKLDENILFETKVVSIMKNVDGGLIPNGISKRVTIQAPNNKRDHDDTGSSEDLSPTKKSRYTDYCSLM